MTDNIISHNEMCRREGVSLQRGMNFGLRGGHSVILMSVRPNAPYRDSLEQGGTVLVYEGHDHPKGRSCPTPKIVDQPGELPSGKPTENGKFFGAAQSYKAGQRAPERVRVYEKIKKGIWSYNGVFHLVDAWTERDELRLVYKFRLVAIPDDLPENVVGQPNWLDDGARRRIIPTAIKLEVWKRDAGKCRICDAVDELHFDHILPFSKGGTSLTADNVQLLCARHNLQKHDRIE